MAVSASYSSLFPSAPLNTDIRAAARQPSFNCQKIWQKFQEQYGKLSDILQKITTSKLLEISSFFPGGDVIHRKEQNFISWILHKRPLYGKCDSDSQQHEKG